MRMGVKAVIEERRAPTLYASSFVQELLAPRRQIFNYENRICEIVCAESDIQLHRVPWRKNLRSNSRSLHPVALGN